MAKQTQKEFSTAQLKAMLSKNSGATASEVKYAIRELKKRGEPTPPPSTVTGGRGEMAGPLPRPTKNMSRGGMSKKAAMMRGGMANGKEHMYAAGGAVKDNPGLKALKAASPEAYNKITGK